MAAPVDSAPWKRKSWRSIYSKQSSGMSSPLPTPTEGLPLDNYSTSTAGSSPTSEDPVPLSMTPKRRSSTNSVLTLSQLDDQASQLILNALERTNSQVQKEKEKEKDTRSSFGKLSFGGMMGGFSLSRSSNSSGSNLAGLWSPDDSNSRGRSMSKDKQIRSSSAAPAETEESSRSRSRARSQSPFTFRRFGKAREPSPPPQSLAVSDAELSDAPPTPSIRPRNAFSIGDNSDSDEDTALETEDDSWSEEEDFFDPITERNTEKNAVVEPINSAVDADVDVDPDPLGEGVNVVVPPEPYFPTSLNSLGNTRNKRGPRRRKTLRPDPLPLDTGRPVFKRDRCTITITQGQPDIKLEGRKRKRYVIASDLSEESRYAVEWGIGTVLRDGDEMLIVTVTENESKVDPPIPNAADRAAKLRSQQERQGLAYILLRQVTSLLQRTKLHVRIACQAWHAKNARHMILDIVDYYEPTMLIVGSRGLGQLKGILLGSTSHYLIQKCSVPVMVARRRLRRPPRHQAHLSKNRAHVKLSEAGIDRMAAKVDQDVEVMRQEVERDDKRREGEMDRMGEDAEAEDEEEDDVGVKVAG